MAAALRYCREQTEPKRVVTFVCDSGNKYLSKMYNDVWMEDQGFISREAKGDLRDLIPYRHLQQDTVTANPDDSLLIALNRMKLYDISQLPVLDANGKVVGSLMNPIYCSRCLKARIVFRRKSALSCLHNWKLSKRINPWSHCCHSFRKIWCR